MKAKVIKIGSSAGVTIPKRQLTELNLKPGDHVEISVKPAHKPTPEQTKLLAEYQDFVAKYGQTLKNLAKR